MKKLSILILSALLTGAVHADWSFYLPFPAKTNSITSDGLNLEIMERGTNLHFRVTVDSKSTNRVGHADVTTFHERDSRMMKAQFPTSQLLSDHGGGITNLDKVSKWYFKGWLKTNLWPKIRTEMKEKP